MLDRHRERGYEIAYDAAANTYMTLPGRDRQRPRVIVGSHLDSVADGGNFDGAAGVIAGLAVYVRGDDGRLAAARIYDDADPPLRGATDQS